MGTIVCQQCDQQIGHFEGEKVSRLYAVGICSQCQLEKDKDGSKS